MCRLTRQGQSLSEYGLMIGLVVVVSLAALVSLGQNVATGLGDSMSGFGSGSTTPSGNPGGDGLFAGGPATSPGGVGQIIVGSPNGSTFTLTNYPMDPASLVETSGADGTINLYATSLNQLADQLLASGQIDNETALKIRNMANKGFDLADNFPILKNRLSLRDDPNTLTGFMSYFGMTTGLSMPGYPQTWSGSSTHPTQDVSAWFSRLESYDSLPPATQQMVDTYNKVPPMVKEMLQNYRSIESNLSPQAKQVIKNAIVNMTMVSEQSGRAYFQAAANISDDELNQLASGSVSAFQGESSNICESHEANGSTGVQCVQAVAQTTGG